MIYPFRVTEVFHDFSEVRFLLSLFLTDETVSGWFLGVIFIGDVLVVIEGVIRAWRDVDVEGATSDLLTGGRKRWRIRKVSFVESTGYWLQQAWTL